MLADESEALVLPDGTKIDPLTGRRIDDSAEIVEVPTLREAQQLVTATKRTVADLPDVPNTMNPINVVLTYQLFGLSVQQIAIATKLPVEQVAAIQQHDAYETMRSAIVENLVSASTDEVTRILQDGRRKAATKMVRLVDSQDDELALKASSAVMTHAKSQEAGTNEDDELVIVIKRKSDGIPNINIGIGD